MKRRCLLIATALLITGSVAHAEEVSGARENFVPKVNPCPRGFYWDGSKCVIKEIGQHKAGKDGPIPVGQPDNGSMPSSAFSESKQKKRPHELGATVPKCPDGMVPVYHSPHANDYHCERKPDPQDRTAAGNGQAVVPTPDANTAARAIEKKDIRRGMVLAKPGSVTPHARTGAQDGSSRPIEVEAQGSPAPSNVTIKEKSSNIKKLPQDQSH